MEPLSTRVGTLVHRFRSNVLDLLVVQDRLLALTERGLYMQDKNGKRWRKVAPYPLPQPPHSLEGSQ